MKQKLLIVYAQKTDEIYNRKSALGSYINSFADLLSNIFDISINGEFINDAQKKYTQKHVQTQEFKKISYKRLIKKILPIKLKLIIKDIALFKKNNKLINNILSDTDYDLIFEFSSYGSNVGYRLSNKLKIPLVLLFDAPVIEEYKFFQKKNPFFDKIITRRERKSLTAAQKIIVYSNAVKKYLIKKYHINANKFVIHQNIDFSRFEFSDSKPDYNTINIGFIGSFLYWHRVDLLVKAFEKLKDKAINTKLYLIGAGMEYQKILKQVSKSKFKESIILTGFIDGKQLLKYKKLIHIGVMPSSNWYGAPNKLFEYGAAKMAVVAPSTQTICDLFNNKEDLLFFKNNSFDSLYNILDKLVCDETTINKLANNLHKKIKTNYSSQQTLIFYQKLFNEFK